MNFLAKLLRAIAYVPAIVQSTEALFGPKNGASKKDAALALVSTAIAATGDVAGKDIVAPDKFQQGLGMVIDGVVSVLNASLWAKQ